MAARVPKICQKQKKLNSLYYLKKAKQSCTENNYSEAYEYFVHYFESLNDPSQSTEAVQTAFTKIVCKTGTVLEETDNIEELLKCYLQALNLFPNNYVILNNLGAYMFKVGEIDIARRYLELAVKVNKDYLPAEKNLMHVKWHQIPRWHFRMLNDMPRNEAYEKAINSTICKGYKNVVDIGAGCGLLSLIAARNCDVKVTAIEENKTLYKMCRDILKENNVNNVNLLNSYSTDLTGPPDKCNLLVTEIFDVALFGERALETILHALTVLRTEDDFKIIPCGAKVYVSGINSIELSSKYHYYIPKGTLNLLNLRAICLTQYDAEPYEAEYLLDKDIKYITDTQQVFNINFYNYEQICTMLKGEEFYQIVQLKCKTEGIVHVLAVWFDLNLTEEISITTNPLSEECVKCWEQAVFYLDHPVYMKEGEVLLLKVTIIDCKLKFTIINKGGIAHQCLKVSKEVITFINDVELVKSIADVANKFDSPNYTVMDVNVFPLLGFLLAKKNFCVYHTIKNEIDMKLFEYILAVNNIPPKNFTIVNRTMPLKPNQNLSLKPNQNLNTKPTLYFFDAINVDGSLEANLFKDKTELTRSIKIPLSVRINVQLIYSWYIDHCNRVKDENALNFNIAKFMNEYTGREHPNLEDFKYVEYSNPVIFNLEGDGEACSEVLVNKNGVVNCLYFWYHIQFYEDIVFTTLASSNYKKCCFFLDNPKTVKLGDIYKIVMKTESSYLKLSLQ